MAAAAFLPKQSLWLDESMQMAGLALGPANVVPFLTGHERHEDIFPDRTPPLGYWLQQGWGAIFGGNERSRRWMGICAVGLATLFVFHASRRAFGLLPACTAGVLFALSPNVLNLSVEIRAYPLFLLFAAATTWAFVRERTASDQTRNRWLSVVVTLAALTSYIHFFGVVMSAAIFLAIFIARRVQRQKISPVALAGVAFVIAVSGLLPFLKAAVGVSKEMATVAGSVDREPSSQSSPTRDVARLAYRLVAHPTLAVSKPLTAAALLGAAGAFTAAISSGRRSSAAAAVLAALALGLIAVMAASFIVHSFHPAAANYNTWALPILFIALSAGVAAGRARHVALVGIALLLAAELYSTYQFAVRGQYFAHGPYARIADQIRQLDPAHVTVLLDGPDTSLAAGFYYPVRGLLGGRVAQFIFTPSLDEPRVRSYADGTTGGRAIDSLPVGPNNYVLVVRTRNVSSDELTARLHQPQPESPPLLPPGPIEEWLVRQTEWKAVESRAYLSFVAARVTLFQRVQPH